MDLSNMWESWMPQIVDHMRSWKRDFPTAARLFFGTIITAEMVGGKSLKGTGHVGLEELYEEGSLTAVFNLSGIVAQDSAALRSFDNLTSEFDALLDS